MDTCFPFLEKRKSGSECQLNIYLSCFHLPSCVRFSVSEPFLTLEYLELVLRIWFFFFLKLFNILLINKWVSLNMKKEKKKDSLREAIMGHKFKWICLYSKRSFCNMVSSLRSPFVARVAQLNFSSSSCLPISDTSSLHPVTKNRNVSFIHYSNSQSDYQLLPVLRILLQNILLFLILTVIPLIYIGLLYHMPLRWFR